MPFSEIPSGPEINLMSDVVRHIVADSLILKTEDSRCNDALDYIRRKLENAIIRYTIRVHTHTNWRTGKTGKT